MRLKGLLVTFFAVFPALAHAEFQTGNQLLKLCTAKDPFHKAECLGYVEATMDTVDTIREMQGAKSCLPDSVDAGQLQDAVVRYLQANPTKRTAAGSALVVLTLRANWPCPK
jgi:hypothetical protein